MCKNYKLNTMLAYKKFQLFLIVIKKSRSQDDEKRHYRSKRWYFVVLKNHDAE